MSDEQQSLPGTKKWRTVTEWIEKWIADNDPHGKDAIEVRKDAYAEVPHGLLKSADQLLWSWFLTQFNNVAKRAGFRLTEVTDDNGGSTKQYGKFTQLSLTEAYDVWLSDMIRAVYDRRAIRRSVQLYIAANPECGRTVDEIMDDLQKDAGAA